MLATPGSHQLLMSASIGGTNKAQEFHATQMGINIKEKSDASGFLTDLGARYGLTENFYLGGAFSYRSESGSSETTADTMGTAKSTSKTEGISDPSLMAGAQLLSGNTRFIGEIEGTIPTGPSKSTVSNQETTYDNREGGYSISSTGWLISDLGSVKLIGALSYTLQGERKSEEDNKNSLLKTNLTTTGGNAFTVGGGVEIPSAMNWGALLAYSKPEDSKTKNELTGVETTSKGLARLGATTYMSFNLAPQTLILPTLSYITFLEKEANGITLDKVDLFTFGLTLKSRF